MRLLCLPCITSTGAYLAPTSTTSGTPHLTPFPSSARPLASPSSPPPPQESGNLAEWDALLARTLGPRYVLLAAESLRGIHLVVAVARGLRPYCGPVAASSVATGLGNVIGNKVGDRQDYGVVSKLAVGTLLLPGCECQSMCCILLAPPDILTFSPRPVCLPPSSFQSSSTPPGRRGHQSAAGRPTPAAHQLPLSST
jgi:hypothetical protein